MTPEKIFLQIIRQSGCANLIDSDASLQSSHGCTCMLNTVAWVVELTYLHVIVKFEGLLGGHGKARYTLCKWFCRKACFEAKVSNDLEISVRRKLDK